MERIKLLKDLKKNKNGEYILYWMQQSQRVTYNHALNYAIEKANKFGLPLIVAFGVTAYPEANERHYYFMLEGLKEVKEELEKRGITFIIKIENPVDLILELSKQSAITVVDKGYLKVPRDWRNKLAEKIEVPLVEVESDLVVPIEEASKKEEYAAYTIRKKITNQLSKYLEKVEEIELINKNRINITGGENLDDIQSLIDKLNLDKSVHRTKYFKGGYSSAKELLDNFIKFRLEKYSELKNDPTTEYTSNLSPYLHFGQISPLEIALEIKSKGLTDNTESFLEELIVRRELAFNFCYYNENYDNYKGLSANWIFETLEEHKKDTRDYVYDVEQFEKAKTHDEIWNACQKELVITGDMHGYMRMYWGKKILEWTKTPEEAFEMAIYLNNKYALDGRDPNSYTGIAWCFGKHDRPWFERNIFGKVRYMNDSGLRRKFKVDEYVKKIDKLK